MLKPEHTSHKRAEFHGKPGESYVYLHEIHGTHVVNTWCLYGIGGFEARIVRQIPDQNADDKPVLEGHYQSCYAWLIKKASEIQQSNNLQLDEEVILLDEDGTSYGVIIEIYPDANTCKVAWKDVYYEEYKYSDDFIPLDSIRRRPDNYYPDE